MVRRPPISTRTDTLFPSTTLFRSHAVAHRIERVLARGVSTESRPRLGRSQRRDVDDVAAALRLHRPDCRAAGVQRRHQVDVEHAAIFRGVDVLDARSEEHTSELQSLMRNSYAVLFLKKKKYKSSHL